MPCHPADLSLNEIHSMNRSTLIGSLLEFNAYSALRFQRNMLAGLSNTVLRQMLMEVRRHYQARGY